MHWLYELTRHGHDSEQTTPVRHSGDTTRSYQELTQREEAIDSRVEALERMAEQVRHTMNKTHHGSR
jgi:hypothetical protein